MTAVATDPEQGGRLYAATENEIFWSGNNGENWNRFDTRIPPRTFNDLAATPDWHDLRRLIQRRRRRPPTDNGAGPTALNTNMRNETLGPASGGRQLADHGGLR